MPWLGLALDDCDHFQSSGLAAKAAIEPGLIPRIYHVALRVECLTGREYSITDLISHEDGKFSRELTIEKWTKKCRT